jgi:hypothetical protein
VAGKSASAAAKIAVSVFPASVMILIDTGQERKHHWVKKVQVGAAPIRYVPAVLGAHLRHAHPQRQVLLDGNGAWCILAY